ncbi:MAG: glycoside hydrolase family 31 protein [Chloroflexota bacterium]
MFRYLGTGAVASQDDSSVRFIAGDVTVEITACTPRIIRVRCLPADPPAASTYVIDREWPETHMEVSDGPPVVLRTAAGEVSAQLDPLRLTLSRNGRVLVREPRGGGMALDTVVDEQNRRRIQARFEFEGEQHFYGLGQGGQQFDRLGGTRQLWNSHVGHGPGSDTGIPLLVSTAGYGMFFDNTADAMLSMGRSDDGLKIAYTAECGRLEWYWLVGEDIRGVMNEVAELLGRPVMPPKWATGFMQSTRHFVDTEELWALPRTLREKRFPCDAIILLSTYGDALGWNTMVGYVSVQPDLIPDPAALLAELRGQHFEVITHEYPVVHPDAPQFKEAEERGFLVNAGYADNRPVAGKTFTYQQGQRYIDFSNPDARVWWWEQHRPLVDIGVGGWWLDGGEGAPASAQLQAGDGRLLHNIYDRLRHKAFFEGEARDRPDQRVILLCRSGAAGMQQYGSGTWSGDINNAFATFEPQIPLGLNTGMSGVPLWGTDIGGFFHPAAESSELYARWFQFGTFCALFRSHGWVWREHVPWAHGVEVEGICRQYAELRYRLLPYVYTLFWQAYSQGLPLMRPLVLNHPDDPRVWELGSQYTFGDDFLVAPVTREGARNWPVYLPEGTWYDFWTGQAHHGPKGVAIDAPLDRLPLLVRAGAIIPTGPTMQHTGERPLEEVTVLVYPSRESSFDLYEDDGTTNAYQRGGHAITTILCRTAPDGVAVTIARPRGDTSLVPSGRTYTLRVRQDGAPSAVAVEGAGDLRRLDDAGGSQPGWWREENLYTVVRLPRRASLSVTLRR